MKEIKRFIRKHRDQILSYAILGLSAAILGLTVIYLLAESMNGGYIFFLVAMLMVALAMNYSTKKNSSKGVVIFYIVTAIACVAIGLLQFFLPTPMV